MERAPRRDQSPCGDGRRRLRSAIGPAAVAAVGFALAAASSASERAGDAAGGGLPDSARAAGPAEGEQPEERAIAVEVLSDDARELRERFNVGAEKVRLLILFAPT